MALAERGVKIMPEILALGGGATADGVGASLDLMEIGVSGGASTVFTIEVSAAIIFI